MIAAAQPWLRFPFDPTVDAGLLAATAAYVWAGRRSSVSARQALFFASGLAAVWLALETPLDTLGDHYLQSAHMAQHMVLIAVAPPLFLLGLTPGMAAALLRLPGLRLLIRPLPALGVYALVVIGWHIPRIYDAGLSNELLHVIEHLTFMGAGICFWWPAIRVTGDVSDAPLSSPLKLVYLFVGTLPMMGVALPLQFSREVFYAGYASAPRVAAGLTPTIDQTVAGALMMLIDMAVVGLDMVVVLFRWLAEDRAESEESLPVPLGR